MKTNLLFAFGTVTILLGATPAIATDKKEFQRRVDNSRGKPSDLRINEICAGDTSNLCTKLRAEASYRDLWLSTMDKLSDAEAATDAAIAKEQRK